MFLFLLLILCLLLVLRLQTDHAKTPLLRLLFTAACMPYIRRMRAWMYDPLERGGGVSLPPVAPAFTAPLQRLLTAAGLQMRLLEQLSEDLGDVATRFRRMAAVEVRTHSAWRWCESVSEHDLGLNLGLNLGGNVEVHACEGYCNIAVAVVAILVQVVGNNHPLYVDVVLTVETGIAWLPQAEEACLIAQQYDEALTIPLAATAAASAGDVAASGGGGDVPDPGLSGPDAVGILDLLGGSGSGFNRASAGGHVGGSAREGGGCGGLGFHAHDEFHYPLVFGLEALQQVRSRGSVQFVRPSCRARECRPWVHVLLHLTIMHKKACA